MNKIFINQSSIAFPRKYLSEWIDLVERELKKRKVGPNLKKKELCIVFLNQAKAKSLNNKYRKKNYATDVLSFEGAGDSLGELIICPQVVKKQAKQHDINFRQECAYLVLHGILHLLGFEHENDDKEAQKMYKLQDSIFQRIR